MTGDAPNWFAKVGPWTALLCASLLLMAILGAVQVVLIRQAGAAAQMAYEVPGADIYIGLAVAMAVARIAVFLIAFGLLASQFQRGSVIFVVAALWFIYPVLPIIVGFIREALIDDNVMAIAPTLVTIDVVVNLVITAYLLFSRRVAELYDIDTRTRIPATLRKLWAQARGRPIPEEIEASRLHETFK